MLNIVRYKENVYPDYKIDTETGEVYHNDVKLEQKLNQGRPYVMIEGIPIRVHWIQAQSEWGYRPGNDVHHEDGNPLNNALSNLNYDLSHAGHQKLEKTGKKRSEETKKKISVGGKKRYENPEERKKSSEARLGKKHSEETRKKMSESAKRRHKKI